MAFLLYETSLCFESFGPPEGWCNPSWIKMITSWDAASASYLCNPPTRSHQFPGCISTIIILLLLLLSWIDSIWATWSTLNNVIKSMKIVRIRQTLNGAWNSGGKLSLRGPSYKLLLSSCAFAVVHGNIYYYHIYFMNFFSCFFFCISFCFFFCNKSPRIM